MRVVDEETRQQVRDARLEALEADNYVEEQDNEPDDEYVDDEDDERAQRKARRKANAAQKKKKSGQKSTRRVRNFADVMYTMAAEEEASGEPGYHGAAAGPTAVPPRRLCSVCGHRAPYSCARCGLRFCGLRCNTHHKETRCLKFG